MRIFNNLYSVFAYIIFKRSRSFQRFVYENTINIYSLILRMLLILNRQETTKQKLFIMDNVEAFSFRLKTKSVVRFLYFLKETDTKSINAGRI